MGPTRWQRFRLGCRRGLAVSLFRRPLPVSRNRFYVHGVSEHSVVQVAEVVARHAFGLTPTEIVSGPYPNHMLTWAGIP